MNECLLTVKDVAARMKISERTIWVYRDLGFMPEPIKLRGAVRWRATDIDSWIAAGCPDCRKNLV